MDRNKDGVVTIEEFIESCQKVNVRTWMYMSVTRFDGLIPAISPFLSTGWEHHAVHAAVWQRYLKELEQQRIHRTGIGVAMWGMGLQCVCVCVRVCECASVCVGAYAWARVPVYVDCDKSPSVCCWVEGQQERKERKRVMSQTVFCHPEDSYQTIDLLLISCLSWKRVRTSQEEREKMTDSSHPEDIPMFYSRLLLTELKMAEFHQGWRHHDSCFKYVLRKFREQTVILVCVGTIYTQKLQFAPSSAGSSQWI